MTAIGPARAARVRLLTWLTAAVDVAPGPVRFGIGRELRTHLLSRPLASLGSDGVAPDADAPIHASESASRTVVLVTRSLGTGGVESVVAMLARLLPRYGYRVVVLSVRGGTTADALTRAGVEVVLVDDAAAAARALADIPTDAVAEVHNAPDWLAQACRTASLQLVPVYHTTDLDLREDGWRAQRETAAASAASIAVSDTVSAFCRRHLGDAGPAIEVVPNGVDFEPLTRAEIEGAQRLLDDVAGWTVGDDVVFCSLVRYTLQKNVPGLVAAFLRAAEQRADIRLVVAGPVDDWTEYALAAALASASPHGHRVLLLGPSRSRAVLAASDAFVLDSFFEGWPIAATEAVRAGLPLVLPEVGGAAELVGPTSRLGHRVANAAGSAGRISMRRIRAARRHPSRQRNREELAAALLAVAAHRAEWRSRRVDIAAESRRFAAEAMVEGHAALISTTGARSHER